MTDSFKKKAKEVRKIILAAVENVFKGHNVVSRANVDVGKSDFFKGKRKIVGGKIGNMLTGFVVVPPGTKEKTPKTTDVGGNDKQPAAGLKKVVKKTKMANRIGNVFKDVLGGNYFEGMGREGGGGENSVNNF